MHVGGLSEDPRAGLVLPDIVVRHDFSSHHRRHCHPQRPPQLDQCCTQFRYHQRSATRLTRRRNIVSRGTLETSCCAAAPTPPPAAAATNTPSAAVLSFPPATLHSSDCIRCTRTERSARWQGPVLYPGKDLNRDCAFIPPSSLILLHPPLAMKFTSQPYAPPSPISPQVASPFAQDAPSPLAHLIPTFLRRPGHQSRPSTSSRSRSSSNAPTIVTRSPATSESSTPVSPVSTEARRSSETLGLLDDDPFACAWAPQPLPVYSLPSSPLQSPTRDTFPGSDLTSRTLGHSQSMLQFPTSLSDHKDQTPAAGDNSILPLHRRDRSFTLKAQHPRNHTWQSDRPAFRQRPSLPPLSMLAQQNVVVRAPKSSRARHFPSEPWDKDAHELLRFPRTKSLSPTATRRSARDLDVAQDNKDLPQLPDHLDVPSHPSPIAELEEDEDRLTDVDEDLECPSTPPPSPILMPSFLDDDDDELSSSETTPGVDSEAKIEFPRSGDDDNEPSRLTVTASIAIAVSLVQDSYAEVLEVTSNRPNTQFATSPSPSSCLLPSPRQPALPDLSTSTSTVSSDDTDNECKTEDEGLDMYTSFWRNQQASEFQLQRPNYLRYLSIDQFLPRLHDSPRRVSDVAGRGRTPFPFAEGKRAHSFSAGQPSPYSHISTASRSPFSSGGFPRQSGDRSAPGRSSGSGGGGGRDNRDWSSRKSSDGGSNAGGGGRGDGNDDGRRSFGRASHSALEEETASDDEEEEIRSGKQRRSSSVSRTSSTLRVPRPSERSGSSSNRGSGSNMPPVPPLPHQYQHSSSAALSTTTSARPSIHRGPSRRSSSSSSKSDSDDVPLAQRIPTALTAQKSIRKQARDAKSSRTPRGLGLSAGAGVAPDELASKLLKVQRSIPDLKSSSTPSRSQSQHRPSHNSNMRHVEEQFQSYRLGEAGSASAQPEQQPRFDAPIARRRQISLGPRSERPTLDVPAPPLPRTISPRRTPEGDRSPALSPRSIQPPSRDSSGRSLIQPAPEPQQRAGRSRAMTINQSSPRPHTTQDEHLRRARSTRDAPEPPARAAPPVPVPSLDRARSRSQPASRVPSGSFSTPIPMPPAPGDVQQQRIFISDLQRFVSVEISSGTTAEDVIEMVSAQGELKGRDWMLWELANEFGMERPIRDYERLSDVFASWNAEARLNALMLKQTPLALPLARRAMPERSPVAGGYINWEAKRGKWSKRWLELREHSLFLSKKDNGKDETFLCNLSSFDAYLVKRMHKAPKPFVFAIKSTDNITMFENPSDCVNVFCCESDEGRALFEKILVARSYVLFKERNVLFKAHRTGVVGGGLERSGTRRTPNRTLVGDVNTPSLPPLSFNN